jgi:predicted nucleic acid-binding protein
LIRYLDTSFVVPLIREETISVPVTQFVAGLPPGELAISRGTEVEVALLLARDVRTGVIKSGEARKADMLLGDIVRRSFVVLSPSVGDYDLARRYLHTYESGLRAAEALHLAIAANCRADLIYSFDKAMIRAGERLGLPMSGGFDGDESHAGRPGGGGGKR